MNKKTILVVEDEAIVGMELQESLQKMGFQVPPVIDNGDEVLRAVMTYRPQLILMDIHLKSFIDGIEAAHRVKLLGKTPIIYLTAYPSHEVKDRAMRTDPSAYLIKPVSDKDLKEEVNRALGMV